MPAPNPTSEGWGRMWLVVGIYDTKEEAIKARKDAGPNHRISWHKGKWLLKKLHG